MRRCSHLAAHVLAFINKSPKPRSAEHYDEVALAAKSVTSWDCSSGIREVRMNFELWYLVWMAVSLPVSALVTSSAMRRIVDSSEDSEYLL